MKTMKSILKMPPEARLKRIAEIIYGVDQRCCAADGPVPPTLSEMRQSEIQEIYDLASAEWLPRLAAKPRRRSK